MTRYERPWKELIGVRLADWQQSHTMIACSGIATCSAGRMQSASCFFTIGGPLIRPRGQTLHSRTPT